MIQHILIVGATSDIAIAIAKKYSQYDVMISLAARDMSRLDPLVADLQVRTARPVRRLEFDVLDAAHCANLVDRLDILPDVVVCCVGYLGDQESAQSNSEEAQRIIDINFTQVVFLLEAFAEPFKQRASGTLVAISSVAGDRGRASNYYYGAAKAGLQTFLSGLRNRLFEHDVNVIDVRPGFVNTRMTAGMKLPPILTADPVEVAEAVFRGVEKRKNIIYVRSIWRLIMLVICLLPEYIFKRTKL
jgi:short-subunit dehydrogenase